MVLREQMSNKEAATEKEQLAQALDEDPDELSFSAPDANGAEHSLDAVDHTAADKPEFSLIEEDADPAPPQSTQAVEVSTPTSPHASNDMVDLAGADAPTTAPSKLGSFFRPKPLQQLPDTTQPNPALQRLRETAAELSTSLSLRARENGVWLYNASVRTAKATADSISKLSLGRPLLTLCRNEASTRPCPQLVWVCCTAIAAGGLHTENIFKQDAPEEEVQALLHIWSDPRAQLLPRSASYYAIAGLLKRFLSSLPEPLLTYRLAPFWVVADVSQAKGLLLQLPAANLNALSLVLGVGWSVAQQAAVNEMDALALAQVLTPLLLWKPPRPPPKPVGTSWGFSRVLGQAAAAKNTPPSLPTVEEDGDEGEGLPGASAATVPLEGIELDNVVSIVEYMIANAQILFI